MFGYNQSPTFNSLAKLISALKSVHEATSIIMQIKEFDYTENFGDTEFLVAKLNWVVLLSDFLQVNFPFCRT
jgi:hypothetical protein